MRRVIGWLITLALLAIAAWAARDYIERHPEDFPWTEIDLARPIGAFTGRKLTALTGDSAQCRALVARSGSADIAAPPLIRDSNCGFDDGMRLAPTGTGPVRFIPSRLVTSCPVAASLLLFERDVLQPAATRHFGERVASIDHAGSYSCRRLYGRASGPFSEHATADAFDVLGFRLAGGRRISVLIDWPGSGPEAAFLRDVRDGACRLFATVLSPDYNAAHANHLHLDQAERGEKGWRGCR
jgi:hypothetical protein